MHAIQCREVKDVDLSMFCQLEYESDATERTSSSLVSAVTATSAVPAGESGIGRTDILQYASALTSNDQVGESVEGSFALGTADAADLETEGEAIGSS